ncbi:lycopene cyclase family protein [Gordonia iterans]
MTRLLIVGAGPAGRALAHRVLVHGGDVILVDPDPHRPWTATFGAFADDLPAWLAVDRVIACAAPEFVVYTPTRRAVPRPYATLSATGLQRELDISGAETVAGHVTRVDARAVILEDGRRLTADRVVDARGAWTDDPRIPRQTAYGTFHPTPEGRDPEMVLMDWRGAGVVAPSFSYRVDLGDGRTLVEETCLAGAPPVPLEVLAARNTDRAESPGAADSAEPSAERVDFPLHPAQLPWHVPAADDRGVLRFGAGGGLMHPATGYSIAGSLAAVDEVAATIVRGDDPAALLWTTRARLVYRLRLIGLAVLLGFDGPGLAEFFDAFFRLTVRTQRAYLGGRDDLRGTTTAMWAVFRRLPAKQKARLVTLTGRALGRMVVRTPGPGRPGPRRSPSPRRAP